MKSIRSFVVCGLVALAAAPVWALQPAISGRVTHVADADTFDLLRKDGSTVKIRVHFSDTPEVAHNQFEIDQPGGVKAKAFAEKRLLGELVTVQPRSKSYQRIVCDVVTEDGEDFGLELVMSGHAWLDPRFHPPAKYQAALAVAQKAKRGLWADPHPMAPWDWRAKTREAARLRAKAKTKQN